VVVKPQSDITSVHVSSEAPRAQRIKLNFDGASKGNRRPADGGRILRNHFGGWVQGFQPTMGLVHQLKPNYRLG